MFELTSIRFARSASMVQTVGVDQVADLVDAFSIAVKQDFAGTHPDRWIGLDTLDQFPEPVRIRLRIVVQRSDVSALRIRNSCVAAACESSVFRQCDDTQARFAKATKKFQRTVPGAVFDDDRFEIGVGLLPNGLKTPVQKIAAIQINDDYRYVWFHRREIASFRLASFQRVR